MPLTCGKFIERLLFSGMFEFFQSGVNPRASCINQLLSMTLRHMNLLMLDLKLEAPSLIYQEHFMRHHLQANSKWNIGEFTKPFVGFFKGKKTR